MVTARVIFAVAIAYSCGLAVGSYDENVVAERRGETIPFEGFEGALGPIYDITHARIDVVWYENEEDLNVEWIRQVPDTQWLVHGFGDCSWTPEINRADCQIHTVLPKSDKDPAMCTLGHEVFHAFKGYFHAP